MQFACLCDLWRKAVLTRFCNGGVCSNRFSAVCQRKYFCRRIHFYALAIAFALQFYALGHILAQNHMCIFALQICVASKLYALALHIVQDHRKNSQFVRFFTFFTIVLLGSSHLHYTSLRAMKNFCVICINCFLRRAVSCHFQKYLQFLAVVRWQDHPLWLVFHI